MPLFQEQVIRVAMVAADYTPGEADRLRRDMAAWRRAGCIEQHRERLVSRMVAKGVAPEFAERVFQQIRGFGEYGFPESHAASFALISYATAWLKCHYPAEFTCALLNAQPMGFYSPSTIVEDARRHDVEVRPVDIQASDWDCTLELVGEQETFAVRLGLRYVKGLGEADGKRIATARHAAPFTSLADVARRTGLDAGALQALAEAGAFEGFGSDRRTALWEVKALARRSGDSLPMEPPTPGRLFVPLDPAETIRWDYRTTEMSPRGHPLEAVRATLHAQGLPNAAAVAQDPPRPACALRRGGDLPPAAQHRQGGGLPHAGGRDRLRKRRPVAEGVDEVPRAREDEPNPGCHRQARVPAGRRPPDRRPRVDPPIHRARPHRRQPGFPVILISHFSRRANHQRTTCTAGERKRHEDQDCHLPGPVTRTWPDASSFRNRFSGRIRSVASLSSVVPRYTP